MIKWWLILYQCLIVWFHSVRYYMTRMLLFQLTCWSPEPSSSKKNLTMDPSAWPDKKPFPDGLCKQNRTYLLNHCRKMTNLANLKSKYWLLINIFQTKTRTVNPYNDPSLLLHHVYELLFHSSTLSICTSFWKQSVSKKLQINVRILEFYTNFVYLQLMIK